MKKGVIKRGTIKRVGVKRNRVTTTARKEMIAKANIRNTHIPTRKITREQQEELNNFIKMFM